MRPFCRNLPPNPFLQTILIVTFLFRVLIGIAVFIFLNTRYGLSEQLILGTAIIGVIGALEIFFTFRTFWECRSYTWESAVGGLFKLFLIFLAIGYAVSLGLDGWYIGYSILGIFVAIVIASDFLILKVARRQKNKHG